MDLVHPQCAGLDVSKRDAKGLRAGRWIGAAAAT